MRQTDEFVRTGKWTGASAPKVQYTHIVRVAHIDALATRIVLDRIERTREMHIY